MENVFIKDGLLVIHEGEGRYDTRASFEVKNLIKMIEFEGVRGGHVGWSLVYKNKLRSGGDVFEDEWDFGRGVRWIMDIVKGMIKNGELDIPYELQKNVPSRCY